MLQVIYLLLVYPYLLTGLVHQQSHQWRHAACQPDPLAVAALAGQVGQSLGSNLGGSVGRARVQQPHQPLDRSSFPDC